MQTNNAAKKPQVAKTTEIAANIRTRVLGKVSRLLKCSPAKFEERMQRPGAKYNSYRVSFANMVDSEITEVFSRIDAGTLPMAIKAAHWSALEGTEAERAFAALMHTDTPVKSGSLVSYWMPNSTTGDAA